MAYSFRSIHREVFQKTFLKDVYISFGFSRDTKAQIDENALRNLYAEKFGVSNIEGISDSMLIRSQDELVQFEFDSRHVGLKMKFPAYKSFRSALQWLPEIHDYMELLGVDCISSIRIEKFNELQYKLPDGDVVGSAMKEIFSKELLDYDKNTAATSDKEYKEFEDLARWEKRIVIPDDDSQLTIEYGFSEKDKQNNSGVLTLKTCIESTCEQTAIDGLREKIENYNSILYNAFIWCVNDNIIKKMKVK